MKRVLGIIVLSGLCILLGLSVKWGVAEKVSLVSAAVKTVLCRFML